MNLLKLYVAFLFSLSTAESHGDTISDDILYRDPFNGSANTTLIGEAPEVSINNASWRGSASWKYTGNGSTKANSSYGRSAYLNFTPESGRMYLLTVSARVDARAALDVPFGLGFISSNNASSMMNWWFNANSPWIRIYPKTVATGYPNGTIGTMLGGSQIDQIAVDDVDQFNTYGITLDTRTAEWVATYTINGNPIGASVSYTNGNPDIVGIGFGQTSVNTNNVRGEVSSIELSVVPETGLLLVNDDFYGSSNSVTASPLERDIQRSGWSSTVPLQIGDGRLISTTPWRYAAIELPPISPLGIVRIEADYFSQNNDHFLGLGFANSQGYLHASTDSGPWFQVRGNGNVSLFGGNGLSNRLTATISPPGNCKMIMEYDVLTKKATLSIGGVVVFDHVELTTGVTEPDMHYLIVEFQESTETAGYSLDNVRVEYLPRPRPLTCLDTTAIIDVTNITINGIQLAIDQANSVASSTNPVKVNIPKGNYSFDVPAGQGWVFTSDYLDYTVIDWNGSSILLQSTTNGFLKLYKADHVVVQNIDSIDYSPVPFTQGTVTSVDNNNRTVDVAIDSGFLFPTNSIFLCGRYGAEKRWGHLVDPNVPGRHKEDSNLHYWFTNVVHVSGASSNTFRYSMETLLNQFEVGSRFVDMPRYHNEVFNLTTSKQVTLKNIVIYSAPSFVVGGWNLGSCNFLNMKVLIKPGRLKSSNGDCISGQAWYSGSWIEHCVFEGAGDDISQQKHGSGIYISRNSFKNSRRYGVWLNGSDYAVIENNTFEGMSGESITGYLDDETFGFGANNVIVFRNTITDYSPQYAFQGSANRGYAGISLHWHLSDDSTETKYNADWRIMENSILNWKRTAIAVGNSERIGIFDNTISEPVYDPNVAATNNFLVYNSTNVVIQ